MQQHMGIFLVSLALIVGFIVYFIMTQAKAPKAKRDDIGEDKEPQLGQLNSLYDDEIIAIRKIEPKIVDNEPKHEQSQLEDEPKSAVYVLHVMAKAGQAFKGYELLQALLSQGLRFGEMSIFHRYQQTNGKGPVLFSLTSAIEPGTFDIHNMGKCSSPGLTLFMASSTKPQADAERFELMYKTAMSLAKELDGECLDKERSPVDGNTLHYYKKQICKPSSGISTMQVAVSE